jgi:hypothetical protein
METEKFILCDCGAEGLLFSKVSPDFDKEIYVALFTYGTYQRTKPSIWQRIKFCLHYLKSPQQTSDQIILSFDKAQELGKWLIENSKI